MLKIISSVISIALITFIAIFAISNREIVEVVAFPFTEKYSLPVYALVLLSVLFGFLWGSLVMSWNLIKIHVKHRSLNSTLKRHIDS